MQQNEIKDKYSQFVDECMLNEQTNSLFEHVKYFDKVNISKCKSGVKSNLSKHFAFWEHIGASKFIINTITGWETYVINNDLCTPENSKTTPLEGKFFSFFLQFSLISVRNCLCKLFCHVPIVSD